MAIEFLTAEDFLPHIGQCFALVEGDAATGFELISVTPNRVAAPRHRAGFSLMFRSALPAVCGQAVLRLVHPTGGELSLFVVPVGQDAAGVQYEAIFN